MLLEDRVHRQKRTQDELNCGSCTGNMNAERYRSIACSTQIHHACRPSKIQRNFYNIIDIIASAGLSPRTPTEALQLDRQLPFLGSEQESNPAQNTNKSRLQTCARDSTQGHVVGAVSCLSGSVSSDWCANWRHAAAAPGRPLTPSRRDHPAHGDLTDGSQQGIVVATRRSPV